jgi:hypothetical protein
VSIWRGEERRGKEERREELMWTGFVIVVYTSIFLGYCKKYRQYFIHSFV